MNIKQAQIPTKQVFESVFYTVFLDKYRIKNINRLLNFLNEVDIIQAVRDI